VELDGGVHARLDVREQDAWRKAWLVSHAFRVVRYPNEQVLTDIDAVLTNLRSHLATRQRELANRFLIPGQPRIPDQHQQPRNNPPLRRSGEGPGEGSFDGAVRVDWVFIRIPYHRLEGPRVSRPNDSSVSLPHSSPDGATASYLAIDLGAESGRAITGRFDGEQLTLSELHRFANTPVRLPDGLYWDVLALYRETVASIRAGRAAGPVDSVGIDGWAVDYGLLDRDGVLLGSPLHYRNPRFEPMVAELAQCVGATELYRRTGIQSLSINTTCQLLAQRGSPALAAADRLLLIPDLLRFWLTGEATAEVTNASTTQLLSAHEIGWDGSIATAVGIDPAILPPLVVPGTTSGPVSGPAAGECGSSIPVVVVASHDTASAVAAIPATTNTFGYVSSGTWSLVGIELREPTLNDAALGANLTNERGVDGTFRLLKNVIGLWLLQECRRTWRREGQDLSYDTLREMARAAPPFGSLIDPDDPRLLPPGDMPARIRLFCHETGQTPPATPGETTRCILESLACAYRSAFDAIRAASGQAVTEIHVVGGGSRNDLLCQLTANATGLPVLAGPVEATAIGNLLVQAMAAGRIGSLRELREVVGQSTSISTYHPTNDGTTRSRWAEHRDRFDRISATRRSADQSIPDSTLETSR